MGKQLRVNIKERGKYLVSYQYKMRDEVCFAVKVVEGPLTYFQPDEVIRRNPETKRVTVSRAFKVLKVSKLKED